MSKKNSALSDWDLILMNFLKANLTHYDLSFNEEQAISNQDRVQLKIEIMKALEDIPLTLNDLCNELSLDKFTIKPMLDEFIINGVVTYLY